MDIVKLKEALKAPTEKLLSLLRGIQPPEQGMDWSVEFWDSFDMGKYGPRLAKVSFSSPATGFSFERTDPTAKGFISAAEDYLLGVLILQDLDDDKNNPFMDPKLRDEAESVMLNCRLYLRTLLGSRNTGN